MKRKVFAFLLLIPLFIISLFIYSEMEKRNADNKQIVIIQEESDDIDFE